MKYKNITKGILEFRAFNPKGDKVVYKIKPDEIIETTEKINWYGLEKVKDDKKIKGDK